MQNFGVLACLEVAEKFLVGWWSRPSLGFSFSQAEQKGHYFAFPMQLCLAICLAMEISRRQNKHKLRNFWPESVLLFADQYCVS